VYLNTIICQTAVCYIHSTILQTLSWLATVPWLDRQEIGRQDYQFPHLSLKDTINIPANLINQNKNSPRGIRPHHCSPFPPGVKLIKVTQDTSPSKCSKRHGKYLSGRAKARSLGQVTTEKEENNE